MLLDGDTQTLSEVQYKCLQGALKNKGFSHNTKILVENCGMKGDNFTATVKRITADDTNGSKLQIIAKVAPAGEMSRQMMSSAVIFGNEILMYQEVLPKLLELQKSGDFPEEDLLKFPECYGVVKDAPHECILLEDMKANNFDIRGRQTNLNNKEVRIILRKLAVFHSLSYALRAKEPATFESFKTQLIDIWDKVSRTPEMLESLPIMENQLLSFLETDEQKALMKGSFDHLVTFSAITSKIDANSKYAVIAQGDCWTNNILFQLEEGNPLDCILIDYQLSRAATPVVDIQYMIFNCTDYETRSQHYFDWIDYYHKMLEDALFNFNLKASFIYPREQLDADLKRYGRFSYGVTLFLSNILTRENEDVYDIKDQTNKDIEEMMKSEDAFGLQQLSENSALNLKNRLIGLTKSFSEFGYISII